MNVVIGIGVLLLVVVGVILAMAQEFGKGGDAAKGGIILVVLCAISGYIVALASGSI
jgi:hypothetical protein